MAKFILYEKAREANKLVCKFLEENDIHPFEHDQLKRAIGSVVLNIAEGNGRQQPKDKRNFFIMARGSAHEAIGVFDMLLDEEVISEQQRAFYCDKIIEVIKILTTIIGRLTSS